MFSSGEILIVDGASMPNLVLYIECAICKESVKEEELEGHLAGEHLDYYPYSCFIASCNTTFASKHDVDVHAEIEGHVQKKYRCSQNREKGLQLKKLLELCHSRSKARNENAQDSKSPAVIQHHFEQASRSSELRATPQSVSSTASLTVGTVSEDSNLDIKPIIQTSSANEIGSPIVDDVGIGQDSELQSSGLDEDVADSGILIASPALEESEHADIPPSEGSPPGGKFTRRVGRPRQYNVEKEGCKLCKEVVEMNAKYKHIQIHMRKQKVKQRPEQYQKFKNMCFSTCKNRHSTSSAEDTHRLLTGNRETSSSKKRKIVVFLLKAQGETRVSQQT